MSQAISLKSKVNSFVEIAFYFSKKQAFSLLYFFVSHIFPYLVTPVKLMKSLFVKASKISLDKTFAPRCSEKRAKNRTRLQ